MPCDRRNNHFSIALPFVTESIFLYEYKFGEHFAYAVWRYVFVLRTVFTYSDVSLYEHLIWNFHFFVFQDSDLL